MAVITSTDCLLKKICQIQGIVLYLVLFGIHPTVSNPANCDLAKKNAVAKELAPKLMLNLPHNNSICYGDSCCSKELEKILVGHSQFYLQNFLKESISKVSFLIDTRARKFDECFRGMMNASKNDFHQMFQRTYGKIYLQNAEVFSDFFEELNKYYKKGTVRLSDTLDTFFGILYQRMFKVINAQFTFDEKYLDCVSETMFSIKPFGDVPNKLGVQLRRSFVATRTFYKSLLKGAEVASNWIKHKIDSECIEQLTQLQFCGVCKGAQHLRSCSYYCEQTIHTCLRSHIDFSTAWDNFVDAIEKVAERLLGPYNIQVVVEPLNIKISEAIMNFQEIGRDVSKTIYSKCGKPPLLRNKREANYKSYTEDNVKYEIKTSKMHGRKKNKVVRKKNDMPTLQALIIDIKTKLKDTKHFWLQLPYQYCNNESISAPPSEKTTCWTGVGKIFKKSPSDSPFLGEQIFVLQGLTDKLRKAHQGNEVDLVDDTEEALSGSGRGSGDDDFGKVNNFDENKKETSDNNEFIQIVSESEVNGKTSTDSSDILPPISNKIPEVIKATSGSTNTISLNRALIQYLIPIVMAWFGGAISDFL